MKLHRRTILAGIAGLGLGAATFAQAGDRSWTQLYNGKDLSGWHVQAGKLEPWRANDEMISCVAPGGGYLTSDRQYGDFELRLEYRIYAGGNSGIGLRFPPGGHPSSTGLELQILDDGVPKHRNLQPAQYNGSLYKLVPPLKKAAKAPPEWNRLEIRCEGPRVRVKLNGVRIQDANADDFQTAEGDLIPFARRPHSGCIGLQSHEDPVDFRKIEIRELK